MNHAYSYLALGDSYTIGEGVPLSESYPYQAVQLLRKQHKNFLAPEIIARTGWTTAELLQQINNIVFSPSYEFVTLLIGVNNQYRNQPADQYAREFEELLRISLEKANNRSDHVAVLSIPDWGLTPFGGASGREGITKDISHFNSINRALSIVYQVNYIDITTGSSHADHDLSFFTADGLHPSAKTYQRWAKMLSGTFVERAL